MGFPRYSLRWLFIVTALVAVAAYIVTRSGELLSWAAGFAAVLVAAAVLAVVHVAFYGVLRLYARLGEPAAAAPQRSASVAEVPHSHPDLH